MGKNKKGRTLPMSEKHNNGNGPASNEYVPPDVVWDEENPPLIYPCSQGLEHDPNCPQEDCVAEVTTEAQLNLHNEAKAWVRAGMDPSSISTDNFGTACQVNALQQILVKHGVVDQDEVDEEFRKIRYDIMHSIREEMEPQIAAMRRQAAIGAVRKPGLINPFEQ